MAEMRKRRTRKRLTVELEYGDEAVVRRARIQAARKGVTLRAYVLMALNLYVANDEVDRDT